MDRTRSGQYPAAMSGGNNFLLGLNQGLLKQVNQYNDDNAENCPLKCKKEEVDELLNLKRLSLEQPRYEKSASLSEAEWDEDLKLAKVTKVTKNLTKNFSHSRNKSIYLYPEECLCLLEMKCLVLKCNGIQLSIKHAYTLLLKEGDCTFEQFRTYGYLVKLGFRVFRHDAELKKTGSYNSENLTKKPEIPTKKKRCKANDTRADDEFYCFKDKITFPELESTGWVIISRPPLCFTPYNIQPNYDVYSFNTTVCSNTIKITEVISFYESLDLKKTPFYPGKPIVYDSSPTGVYPMYEKNIKKNNRNIEQIMYEPQIKRFKFTKTETDVLSISSNMTTSTNETNVCKTVYGINKTNKTIDDLKYEENMDTNVCDLPIITNVIASTLNIENNLCSSNDNVNLSFKMHNYLCEKNHMLNDEAVTGSDPSINLNTTKKIECNCNLLNSKPSSDTDAVNEAFSMRLPSYIKQKLFAIKSNNIYDESIDNSNNKTYIKYDVYYPDNDFPKKSRPVPDFRVIVFENELSTIPNIYNVNISSPNDNIPTLWAIVNSNSVSFYNVDNIILPKPTDWKIKGNLY